MGALQLDMLGSRECGAGLGFPSLSLPLKAASMRLFHFSGLPPTSSICNQTHIFMKRQGLLVTFIPSAVCVEGVPLLETRLG